MKIEPKYVLGAAALALAGGIALVGWWNASPATPALRPNDAGAVARGAEIYRAKCASCHGARLEGQPNWRSRRPDGKLPAPPHDKTGHTWHHGDAMLFDLTKKGPAGIVGGSYQSDMPGFAEILSDDEIIDVLSYIKSTWPASVRQRHDMINQRPK